MGSDLASARLGGSGQDTGQTLVAMTLLQLLLLQLLLPLLLPLPLPPPPPPSIDDKPLMQHPYNNSNNIHTRGTILNYDRARTLAGGYSLYALCPSVLATCFVVYVTMYAF